MLFKVDENLPVEVVDVLRQHNHDALTVAEQHLAGQPDANIARICQAEQRTLITLDLDFSDIRRYPPAEYAGFIVLRPHTQSTPSVLQLCWRSGTSSSLRVVLPCWQHKAGLIQISLLSCWPARPPRMRSRWPIFYGV